MLEISTIIGLVLAFGSLLLAFIIENGWNFGSVLGLWAPTAFMIVIGGSFGALFVAFPMEELKTLPALMRLTFQKNNLEAGSLVAKLVKFAEKARREGLLALETEVAAAGDPFLQKGIQLVADGLDQETIKDMLETELDFVASRHAAGTSMLEALGGFAPTLGVLGTVMGLVLVLGNLSDPQSLGPAIAVAFLATLYGVGSANLIFLPMAQKLKRKSEEELLMREVMIAGIISIQAGDNPQIVEEKLKSYLSPAMRKQLGRGKGGDEKGKK